MTSSVSASGTIQSPLSIGVDFKSGGQLVSVDVKPGQHVAKGQVLAAASSSAKVKAAEGMAFLGPKRPANG